MTPAAEAFSNGSDVAQRTCVGCKRAAAREELLRLVLVGGEAQTAEPAQWIPDIRRRLPGRGMSVHPTRACLALAFKQGRMRAGTSTVSVAEIATAAAGQYRRRMEGLIIGAWRAKQLAVGAEAVRESLAQRTMRLLVLAHDAAGNRDDFEHAAERLGRRCLVWGTKMELGALLGRETVGVLGFLNESIGEELRSAAQHLGALAEDA